MEWQGAKTIQFSWRGSNTVKTEDTLICKWCNPWIKPEISPSPFLDSSWVWESWQQQPFSCQSKSPSYCFSLRSLQHSWDCPMSCPVKFEDTGQDIGPVWDMSSKSPQILIFMWKKLLLILYFFNMHTCFVKVWTIWKCNKK